MLFLRNTLALVRRKRLVAHNMAQLPSQQQAAGFTSSSSSSLPYLQQLFSLEGRCAIVTGGGTGIGAALAQGLARAGASVVLTGRREGPLQDCAAQIRHQLAHDEEEYHQKYRQKHSSPKQKQQPAQEASPYERRVVVAPCDITNFDAIPELIHQAHAATGIPPTIFINNAGRNVRQPARNVTVEHWNESTTLMLTAPFVLAQALADHMKHERYGRIISLASLQSYQAFPDSIPYAASKAGILGFTRALAEAYAPIHGYDGVTVNAIAPGYVQTELTKSVFADPERSQRLADATILGRNSVPDDLVGAVVFLASPAAAYITGQTIPVDGGFTALGLR